MSSQFNTSRREDPCRQRSAGRSWNMTSRRQWRAALLLVHLCVYLAATQDQRKGERRLIVQHKVFRLERLKSFWSDLPKSPQFFLSLLILEPLAEEIPFSRFTLHWKSKWQGGFNSPLDRKMPRLRKWLNVFCEKMCQILFIVLFPVLKNLPVCFVYSEEHHFFELLLLFVTTL